MVPVLLVLAACTGKDDTGTGPAFEGPVLTHTPPTSVLSGTPLGLSVVATDLDGVSDVTLFHRVQGASEWSQAPMAGAGDDTWTAEIGADNVTDPAVEYYFKAVDAGETPATSYLPDDPTDNPFVVPVTVEGLPLPFVEDFELAEGESDLSQLGWGSASLGFRGYPWQLSNARAYSGSSAVFHPHGYEDVAGMQDWLVSPALDFSSTSQVQVTWREWGNNTATAVHKLYVSTGSRDPASGDYVLVADALPAPPEEEWGRSQVVDLSAFAGSAAVYLAWYWEGVDADDWYLDDVTVQGLQPDLGATWAIDPSPVHPGETTTLTVTVANAGLVEATNVDVTVTFPDSGATVGTPTASTGAIAAGGTGDAAFEVRVDAGATDNRYLPFTIDVDWGADGFSQEERFLVGNASVASVTWSAAEEGPLQLTLGVGDPEAPTWEQSLYSGTAPAGESVFTLDITDQGDLLPPAAGPLRWWLASTTVPAGAVDSFEIAYDGRVYAATVYPPALADMSAVVWLPEPPSLTAAVMSPSSVSPGATGQSLTLNITNGGAATTGALDASLSSSDPDVTVTDGGPLVVSASGLASGARASVSGFQFDVSASHVDSSAVTFDLALSDDVESWLLPLTIDVPWAVPRITSLEIEDRIDGDGDGILDPGEAAEITFTLTNVGDLSTDGTLSGTLTVEGSSTATADASTDAVSYGTLSASSTRTGSDPHEVTVTGGAEGDTVDLLLTLVDRTYTYEARTTLTLGEPPWQSITTSEDPIGDNLDGWQFDIVGGSYREIDGVLQIRLQSADAFDPDDLFIEAWGLSSGSDWIYYRLVIQSNVVTLQGYDYGFYDLGAVSASYPDERTVQFDIPIEILGLLLDEISFGWGSGWCGPDEYYCDHWPDGWGYPYDSFNPSGWYELSW